MVSPATLYTLAHTFAGRKRSYRHSKPHSVTQQLNLHHSTSYATSEKHGCYTVRQEDNTLYFLAISSAVFAEFLVGDTGASLPARPKLYDVILRHTLLIRPPSSVKICDVTNNTVGGC
jgi:hypothetical protein